MPLTVRTVSPFFHHAKLWKKWKTLHSQLIAHRENVLDVENRCSGKNRKNAP